MTLEEAKAKFEHKQVKIVSNRYNAHHLVEARRLAIGELIWIDEVVFEGEELRVRTIQTPRDYQTLALADVVLPEDSLVANAECKCRSLLFGHESGCPYMRK